MQDLVGACMSQETWPRYSQPKPVKIRSLASKLRGRERSAKLAYRTQEEEQR